MYLVSEGDIFRVNVSLKIILMNENLEKCYKDATPQRNVSKNIEPMNNLVKMNYGLYLTARMGLNMLLVKLVCSKVGSFVGAL